MTGYNARWTYAVAVFGGGLTVIAVAWLAAVLRYDGPADAVAATTTITGVVGSLTGAAAGFHLGANSRHMVGVRAIEATARALAVASLVNPARAASLLNLPALPQVTVHEPLRMKTREEVARLQRMLRRGPHIILQRPEQRDRDDPKP